ncbi:MAG: hypothetical protein H6760_00895 [Candidatus Nomurabacteria bacterium]|nr:MAG: hypothetical protein H6760_00895 [Candidatus Nomurabacteria bacterium]
MDINLLKDTQRSEDQKKKQLNSTGNQEMTNPDKLPPAKPEPKLPSRFSTWLQSLRGKKNPKEMQEEEIIQEPIKAPKSPTFDESARPKTEDIFADLDTPSSQPESNPEPIMSDEESLQTFTPPEPKKKQAMPNAVKPPRFTQKMEEIKMTPPPELPKKKVKQPKISSSRDQSFLVNLLPTEFQRSIDPRSKLISLGITVLITALVIGAAYGALTLYRTSILEQIQSLRTERSVVESTISDLRPSQREAITTKERTELVKTLLDQHVYWTRFFEKLEEYTIDDVYYIGAFNGSLGGQITLSAVGTSFSAPARQLIAFQQASDFVSSVRITSARSADSATGTTVGSTGTEQISFSVTLSLLPDLFYYDASTFPLERIGNVTTPLPGDTSLLPGATGVPDLGTSTNTNTSGATNTNTSTNTNSSTNTNTSTTLNSNISNP